MRHRLLTLLCSIALLAPAIAWAHEGHAHKVMGTVTMAAADHLMVKTTDGKDETITLNAKTKVVRSKTAIKSADIKPGTRVVVIVQSDKAPFVATEVQVGTIEKPAAEEPAATAQSAPHTTHK